MFVGKVKVDFMADSLGTKAVISHAVNRASIDGFFDTLGVLGYHLADTRTSSYFSVGKRACFNAGSLSNEA